MYIVSTEHYCGLPQELWDSLAAEAEDLLVEEELGNHILGVYPAGYRIYGIESSSQGLLCLYMDTVESLLDPIYNANKFKRMHIGNQLSPVWFIELHSWVKWILFLYGDVTSNKWQCDRVKDYLHLLPAFGDIVYQDTAIDKLMALIQDYIASCMEGHRNDPMSMCPALKEKEIVSADTMFKYALYYRQNCLWRANRIFNPNMNSDWGDVCDLKTTITFADSLLFKLDDQFQKIIKTNQPAYDFSFYNYLNRLHMMVPSHSHSWNPKPREPISEEVIKLYKAFV